MTVDQMRQRQATLDQYDARFGNLEEVLDALPFEAAMSEEFFGLVRGALSNGRPLDPKQTARDFPGQERIED